LLPPLSDGAADAASGIEENLSEERIAGLLGLSFFFFTDSERPLLSSLER
jgi:hypothetical protein